MFKEIENDFFGNLSLKPLENEFPEMNIERMDTMNL
jgi:hypothetical protein